eukprot:9825213-Alexandrium_andersonii.AAC.1
MAANAGFQLVDIADASVNTTGVALVPWSVAASMLHDGFKSASPFAVIVGGALERIPEDVRGRARPNQINVVVKEQSGDHVPTQG